MRKRAEKLISDLELPDIEVLQSPWIMPRDWDDHEAWNSYYSSWEPDNQYLGSAEDSWQLWRLEDWVNRLRSRNVHRMWLPGCGLDALPWAYAAVGFDVVATDASKTAIEIQRSDEFYRLVLERLDQLDPPLRQPVERVEGLNLRFEAHDFREPFEEAGFDCIINIQAFQALSPESMARAARAYWASLRPGGIAYLSMLNVSHLAANAIERVLSDAGFFVPFELAERKHRIGLHRLGAGISPFGTFRIEVRPDDQRGVIRELHRRWKKRKLERLRAEYAVEKESQEEIVDRARNDGVTKIVELLYNTG
jgi:SAM-dependent methyltransferase